MDRPNIVNTKKGPERIIQDALKDFLEKRGWFVVETHGNMYQVGLPDLWITHKRYGQRWVEVKNPVQYCFTPAQLRMFPKYRENGAGIWILVAATEYEYEKLFKPPNWGEYLVFACLRD